LIKKVQDVVNEKSEAVNKPTSKASHHLGQT